MDVESYQYKIPRFSREWWENFWYYRKGVVIVVIVTLIGLAALLAECALQVKPDLQLAYIGGPAHINGFSALYLEDALVPLCRDITGNGKVQVKVDVVNADPSVQTEDMAALLQLGDLEVSASSAVIFLLDEKMLARYIAYGLLDLAWLANEMGVSSEGCKYDETGAVCAIEADWFPLIAGVEGVNPDGLYLAARPRRPSEEKKGQEDVNYAHAMEVLEKLAQQ